MWCCRVSFSLFLMSPLLCLPSLEFADIFYSSHLVCCLLPQLPLIHRICGSQHCQAMLAAADCPMSATATPTVATHLVQQLSPCVAAYGCRRRLLPIVVVALRPPL
jgi:hypothetical protein